MKSKMVLFNKFPFPGHPGIHLPKSVYMLDTIHNKLTDVQLSNFRLIASQWRLMF